MSENRYLIAYGELVGRSHGTKIPCQDKALCLQENGVSVAVLSDGCGSAPLSQYGSDLTVKAVSRYLVDHFDEMVANGFEDKGQAKIPTKKALVEDIVKKELEFVKEHPEIFEEHRKNNMEKYEKTIEHHSEESYWLSLLHATLIFFAEKDGKAILGQIGDGFMGAVIDGKMRLFLEEDKIPGAKNATFYPDNIWEFANTAAEGDQWYLHRSYKMGLVNSSKFNAVMLTSDGVESFFIKTKYEKRYAKVDILFDRLIECQSFEERQALINEYYLPRLVAGSPSFDDCSIAILVEPSCKITEFVPKVYPHDDEDEQPSKHVEEVKKEEQVQKKEELKKEDPTKREVKVEQDAPVSLTQEELKYVDEVKSAYQLDYTKLFAALKKEAIANGDAQFVHEYLEAYRDLLLALKVNKKFSPSFRGPGNTPEGKRKKRIYAAIRKVDKCSFHYEGFAFVAIEK